VVKKTADARRQLRFPHICGVVHRLGEHLKRCSRALARERKVAPELPWVDARASPRKPDPGLGQGNGVRPGPESARWMGMLLAAHQAAKTPLKAPLLST